MPVKNKTHHHQFDHSIQAGSVPKVVGSSKPITKYFRHYLQTFYPLRILKSSLKFLWDKRYTFLMVAVLFNLRFVSATYKVIAEDMLSGCDTFSDVVDTQQPVAGSTYNSSVWIAIGGRTRSNKEVQNGGTAKPEINFPYDASK